MLAERKLVTAEVLKNTYLGILAKEQSLMNLIEYHNTELEHTLEWGTLKKLFHHSGIRERIP